MFHDGSLAAQTLAGETFDLDEGEVVLACAFDDAAANGDQLALSVDQFQIAVIFEEN